MSHALSMLAGFLVAVASVKTSAAETAWGSLFIAAAIIAACAWAASNDERSR